MKKGTAVGLLFLTILTGAGCRKGSIKFDKESLRARARGVEVPDFYSTNRNYVQSRGVIAFTLKPSYIGDAHELSLRNLTTKQPIFENQRVSLGLEEYWSADDNGTTLSSSSDELVVRIYPTLPDRANRLIYGENRLRLTALGPRGKRYRDENINMKDFYFFGMNFSGDISNLNSASLQGGITGLTNGISSNGKGFMFTNPVHVMTH